MAAEAYGGSIDCVNCKHEISNHIGIIRACVVKGCPCPRFQDPRQTAQPGTLDGIMADAVIAKEGHSAFAEAMAMETLTGATASAFAEYRAATIGLRDSELGHKAAQDRYRAALVGLNDAIAKAGA